MKEYELTIEIQQPPCGGKPPKRCEVLEIQTDDPIAYVRAKETNAKDENMTVTDDGRDLCVYVDFEKYHAKYTFTEF